MLFLWVFLHVLSCLHAGIEAKRDIATNAFQNFHQGEARHLQNDINMVEHHPGNLQKNRPVGDVPDSKTEALIETVTPNELEVQPNPNQHGIGDQLSSIESQAKPKSHPTTPRVEDVNAKQVSRADEEDKNSSQFLRIELLEPGKAEGLCNGMCGTNADRVTEVCSQMRDIFIEEITQMQNLPDLEIGLETWDPSSRCGSEEHYPVTTYVLPGKYRARRGCCQCIALMWKQTVKHFILHHPNFDEKNSDRTGVIMPIVFDFKQKFMNLVDMYYPCKEHKDTIKARLYPPPPMKGLS
eukprot:gnl/MRDRNA2_/MRDRNA2_14835_c0_seq1.p1 gnl/MRDRNA2_/MRDRNA2_14835_c0~~gnl/MRDRNA2_/MRDRNA2_14835_c0_seq1.p1  ORF type:complete len:296 (+),score=36.83 gnl/MRDRNA2_/MRDRNA2_14835_c0_seq1:67-954(+)